MIVIYIENVSGVEIEIVNYLGYLNDFENYAEDEIKHDAYAILIEHLDGCIEHWADGFYISTKIKNVRFYFEIIEGDWKKETEKKIFEYMGLVKLNL